MHDRPAYVDDAEHPDRPPREIPTWLVLPGILLLVLLGFLGGRWTGSTTEVREGAAAVGARSDGVILRPTPRPEGPTFSLTIDFGNGVEKRFAALARQEGLTVLAAMQAAADYRPGISFAYTGTRETAFLTAVDGLKNAGAGGGNWIYEINGEKPTKGMGLATLQAGDALLWRYSGSP